MLSLTGLSYQVRDLEDLPAEERADAARALAAAAATVLADGRIAEDTARNLWTKLARAVDPRTPAADTAAAARAAAEAVLGVDVDVLAPLRAARKRDQQALEGAAAARAHLRAAAEAAVRAGLPQATVAREAGVSRQTLQQWLA